MFHVPSISESGLSRDCSHLLPLSFVRRSTFYFGFYGLFLSLVCSLLLVFSSLWQRVPPWLAMKTSSLDTQPVSS